MIVFLHIHKTAGSTFQFILENTFGVFACHTNHAKKRVFDQSDFDFARKLFPGMRSLAGHNLIDPLRLVVPDPFYVTFLREPVSRVISHYQDSVVSGNRRTFEEELRRSERLENLQVKAISGGRDLGRAKQFLERCHFVGLTEKFELSLQVLDKLSPYRLNLNYRKRRVAPDNAIRKAAENDPRLIEMIRDYNRLDLELYSFAVNEIFPRVCARAAYDPAGPVVSRDRYTSDWHWNYLLGHFYNMCFYRQICKVRNRWVTPSPVPATPQSPP